MTEGKARTVRGEIWRRGLWGLWPAAVALLLLAALWATFGLARPVAADGPWYVDAATGDDANDCLAPASACASVGAALDKAASGDTVYVAAGTYSETITMTQAAELIGAGPGETVLTSGGDIVVNVDDGEGGATFSAQLEGMTIAGAEDYAGGVVNHENLVVTNIVVEDNNYFGIWNYDTGTLEVSESALRRNGDAALFNDGGTAALNGVTINDNAGGTVVHTQGGGDTSLTNLTVSGNNTGEGTGTAVVAASEGTVSLVNSTIANNSGGGVVDYSDGMTLQNTIVAGNGGYNCWTAVTSLGHNLADDDTCFLDGSGDMENVDPLLQSLVDNGGTTLTHALSDGSPAIDAGDNAACPATDQRGQVRPVDGDDDGPADCDIGAFEYVELGVDSVGISAPATALVETSVTFSAVISPDTANRPITYTWTADGQTTVTHTTTGSNDSVTFTWDSPGARNVSVTAANRLGESSDSVQIDIHEGVQGVTGVAISGPTRGNPGEAITFTAEAAPANATLPVTYTWQIDGQDPVTDIGGLSDQVVLSWPEDGTYTLAVTATNAAGSASDMHSIDVTAWYVDTAQGDDGNDCQTPTSACETIQAALNKAPTGALLHVAAGTYSESVSIAQAVGLVGAGAGETVLTADSGTVVTVNDGRGTQAEVRLEGMTIEEGPGGGIVNRENLLVTGSVIQNHGGYAIHNYGAIEVRVGTIRGNTASGGAALMNRGGMATLVGVTVSGNTSDSTVVHTHDGGATSLTNVTVSGNETGDGTGSAVTSAADATVAILNSTIVHNSGGGVSSYGAQMTLQNTVLADNGGDNCWTEVTSLDHNVEDGGTCALDGEGDQPNTDPLLGPLADNGGMTLTHLPDPDSPLIDAGDSNACPDTDQRGEARPFDGDEDGAAVCDVGAVEVTLDAYLFLPVVMH